jgi:hypothetical protein
MMSGLLDVKMTPVRPGNLRSEAGEFNDPTFRKTPYRYQKTSEALAAAENRPLVSNLAGRSRVRLSAEVRIMQSPRRKAATYVLIALAILVLMAIPIWLSTGPAVLAPGINP